MVSIITPSAAVCAVVRLRSIMSSFSTLRGCRNLGVSFISLFIAAVVPSASAEFISALSRCPIPCSSSGSDPASWTYYHDLRVFTTCNETILFDTNLYNAVNDTTTHIGFRACTTDDTEVDAPDFITVDRRHDLHKCAATVDALSWGSASSDTEQILDTDGASATSAVTKLSSYAKSTSSLSTTIFSHLDGAVAGFYVGPGIDLDSATAVMDAFALTTGAHASRWAVPVWGRERISRQADFWHRRGHPRRHRCCSICTG